MSPDTTIQDMTCSYEVGEPPYYLHWHRCGKKAKAVITTVEATERAVCGIHLRKHQRSPLHEGWFVKVAAAR